MWGHESFKTKTGEDALFVFGKSKRSLMKELENAPDGARYGVYLQWKGKGRGSHVFIAEKQNGQIRYIDPQNGNMDVSSYFKDGKRNSFGFMRFDDKVITDDTELLGYTVGVRTK